MFLKHLVLIATILQQVEIKAILGRVKKLKRSLFLSGLVECVMFLSEKPFPEWE